MGENGGTAGTGISGGLDAADSYQSPPNHGASPGADPGASDGATRLDGAIGPGLKPGRFRGWGRVSGGSWDWQGMSPEGAVVARACQQVSLPLVGRGQGWGCPGLGALGSPPPSIPPHKGEGSLVRWVGGNRGEEQDWRVWLWDRASRFPWVAEGAVPWAHPHPRSLPTRGREAPSPCPALKTKTTVSFPTVVELVR